MATKVILPKMGLTMTEATIQTWHVKEGDTVQEEDVLCEVTTEKLTNEILAKEDGTILKILAQEDETVPVLATIAILGEPGEDYSNLL